MPKVTEQVSGGVGTIFQSPGLLACIMSTFSNHSLLAYCDIYVTSVQNVICTKWGLPVFTHHQHLCASVLGAKVK